MTNRKRRQVRSKNGFGFSGWGLRHLTQRILRGMGVSPHERGKILAVFANVIVISFVVTGGFLGALSHGWPGLLVGAFLGLAAACAWLEADDVLFANQSLTPITLSLC